MVSGTCSLLLVILLMIWPVDELAFSPAIKDVLAPSTPGTQLHGVALSVSTFLREFLHSDREFSLLLLLLLLLLYRPTLSTTFGFLRLLHQKRTAKMMSKRRQAERFPGADRNTVWMWWLRQ
jgi:hypothetical protein